MTPDAAWAAIGDGLGDGAAWEVLGGVARRAARGRARSVEEAEDVAGDVLAHLQERERQGRWPRIDVGATVSYIKQSVFNACTSRERQDEAESGAIDTLRGVRGHTSGSRKGEKRRVRELAKQRVKESLDELAELADLAEGLRDRDEDRDNIPRDWAQVRALFLGEITMPEAVRESEGEPTATVTYATLRARLYQRHHRLLEHLHDAIEFRVAYKATNEDDTDTRLSKSDARRLHWVVDGLRRRRKPSWYLGLAAAPERGGEP